MSGHRRRCFPARDRIVSQAMMGGRTFSPLKTGRAGPEKAKQVEIPVAGLRKILDIPGSWDQKSARKSSKHRHRLCWGWFLRIWLTAQFSRFVISVTVLAVEIAYCPARERR
jgi:hypothetical protein